MLKKQVAALILALGLLSGCASTQQGGTTNQTEPQGSVIEGSSDTLKMTALSDYVKKGTTIADAKKADAFGGVALPVAIGDSYAVAGSEGTPVTDALYDRVKALTSGNKKVWVFYRGKKFTCVSTKGDVLLEDKKGTLSLAGDRYLVWKKANGISEIFAINGTRLTKVKGEVQSAEGGILVSKTKKHWYLTNTETWVTEKASHIKSMSAFEKGVASVELSDGTWGLIDGKGNVTELTDIAWLDQARGGYLLAQNRAGVYGILTTGGDTAVEFAYSKANACVEDTPIYQLWTSDGICTVRNIKTNQSIRLPRQFDGETLTAWQHNYFSFTEEDGTIILFDDLGTMELSAGTKLQEWDDEILVVSDETTMALVYLDDGTMTKQKTGVFVKNKGIARGETDYLTISDPETGLQGIWKLDGGGKELLAAGYDWIRPVGNGLFAAKKNGGCGLVDTKGNWTVYLKDT